MLTAIQHASMASKVVALQAAPSTTPHPTPASTPALITAAQADPAVAASAQPHFANRALPASSLLHMATLGGAELCSIEAHTGRLVPGQAFDALLINLR